MASVKWIIDGIFDADVYKVDAEIKSIGNEITPKEMVSFARDNPESELHKCFEWDDSIAAEKYREVQARKILEFIIEVPENKAEPEIRSYSITTKPNTYMPTRNFLVNANEYQALLQRAVSELKAFEKKYKSLVELETVFAQIDAL